MPVNLFDTNFYRAANPDLAAAGLTTDAQLLSHFQNGGLNQGRAFSAFVNLNFYRASNPDLAQAGLTTNAQLYEHLQNGGIAQGRRFSELVDIDFYLAANSDVNAAFVGNREQAFEHLRVGGVNEGRRFSQFVDPNFYLATNPDVNAAVGGNRKQAFEHLCNTGIAEGRRFSQFVDLYFYLAANSDVAQAVAGSRNLALQHLEISGLAEGRRFSQFFDINYYRTHNPDLVSAGLNSLQLLQHFEQGGLLEGRAFSMALDVNYYRNAHSNLAASGLNNQRLYEHFQVTGVGEGRASSQFFNVKYYLDANADLRAAGLNYAQAYDHFVLVGAQQGRSGVPNLQQQWIRQLGTSSFDVSNGVAIDSAGNVYITGGTNPGNEAADAWVAKYDSLGTSLWTKQLSTSGDDFAYSVAADSAGNIYVTGFTSGSLLGTNAGEVDAWVAKYDSSGTLLFGKQLGTSSADIANGVAVDSAGNIYVTGFTSGSLSGTNAGEIDAWVAKYDSSGTSLWTKQLGTSSEDFSNGMAIDSAGNIYITGFTSGSLSGANAGEVDTWVAKYNSLGNQLLVKQLGTSSADIANGVAVDSAGNIYVTGFTSGSLSGTNAGEVDAWVAKYDSLGTSLWTRQLGTSGSDSSSGVAIDSAGDIYITGTTEGALGGTSAGEVDAWVAKYNSLGNQLLVKQLGTFSKDFSNSIAIDSIGNIYIAGDTEGTLGETSAGDVDAWVAKYR